MTTPFKETIVIAMGGSLLVPESVDVAFLKRLKHMMTKLLEEGYQVALIVGGGKVCRIYQDAARELGNQNHEDIDWIGIKTIHLNTELVLRSFYDLDVYPKVVLKAEDIRGIQNGIIVVGAWEPGKSSDADAVEIARELGASRIINFSNISHVYSEDPRKNPHAEKFEKLSWSAYRKLIPEEWTPGLSAPFDPIASRLADEYGMQVVVLGASLENLENFLSGEKFEGTVIGV